MNGVRGSSRLLSIDDYTQLLEEPMAPWTKLEIAARQKQSKPLSTHAMAMILKRRLEDVHAALGFVPLAHTPQLADPAPLAYRQRHRARRRTALRAKEEGRSCVNADGQPNVDLGGVPAK